MSRFTLGKWSINIPHVDTLWLRPSLFAHDDSCFAAYSATSWSWTFSLALNADCWALMGKQHFSHCYVSGFSRKYRTETMFLTFESPAGPYWSVDYYSVLFNLGLLVAQKKEYFESFGWEIKRKLAWNLKNYYDLISETSEVLLVPRMRADCSFQSQIARFIYVSTVFSNLYLNSTFGT